MVARGGAAGGWFSLLAGVLSCQVVIDLDGYQFAPAREEPLPLSNQPDASRAGEADDAGPSDGGFGALDAGSVAPDASVGTPCVEPACAPGDGCDGCVVGGRCVAAGEALPSNECLVCDPAQSASGYSIAFGKSCGAEATACSAQDTCDEQGFCAPNDLREGEACGAGAELGKALPCDEPDSCDGAGTCVDRRSADGVGCEDGAFCTTGDQCLGGQCVPGGPLQCAENQICVEEADACQCAGCEKGGVCYPAGAADGCFVCDPLRDRTAFSPAEGTRCGDPEGECFGPRTCDATGQCVSRPLEPGAACGDPSDTDCTDPDSCDGSGTCRPNHITDGSFCEDGLTCTELDSCFGGSCVAGPPVRCGPREFCLEGAGCVCLLCGREPL